MSEAATATPSVTSPSSMPNTLEAWLAQLPPRPTSDYLETLFQQLGARSDLAWPLDPSNGTATRFALADGSVLSMAINEETRDAMFYVKYPALGGKSAIGFELHIQNNPRGKAPAVMIRATESADLPLFGLKQATLSASDGVFRVDGQDLRTLFRLAFHRDMAYAGTHRRKPVAGSC